MTNISALTTAVVTPSASSPGTSKPVGTIASAVALVEEEMRAVEARLRERLESPVGAIPEIGAHLLGSGRGWRGGPRARPARRSSTGAPSVAPPS